MSISWPSNLYGYILKDGFQEEVPDNILRSEMSIGPDKIRRRSTAAVRKFSVQMFFSKSLVAAFDTFYVTTSKHGSLAFTYKSPRTESSLDHRFASVPVYTKMDQGYIVSFKLELMP